MRVKTIHLHIKRNKWTRLLAFVLAPMLEKNMRKAFIASQGSLSVFADSTLKLALLAIFLVLVLTPTIKSVLRKIKAKKNA